MEINIKNINGNEILDYLNDLDFDDLDNEIYCQKPFIFETQKINGEQYKLTFSTYFNNWGTDQLIEDNRINITKDSIQVSLNEPFDGDGSSEALEEALTKWLSTHEFSTDYKEEFKFLIEESSDLLIKCQYGDLDILEDVIKKITKAKTLIK
jgi:hypothetical protein